MLLTWSCRMDHICAQSSISSRRSCVICHASHAIELDRLFRMRKPLALWRRTWKRNPSMCNNLRIINFRRCNLLVEVLLHDTSFTVLIDIVSWTWKSNSLVLGRWQRTRHAWCHFCSSPKIREDGWKLAPQCCRYLTPWNPGNEEILSKAVPVLILIGSTVFGLASFVDSNHRENWHLNIWSFTLYSLDEPFWEDRRLLFQ